MPSEMLDSYRVANSLSSPAAFSSSYNSLALTHSSIGRQSPTMARRKDRRRIAKDSLATAVRRHFNGAAVNELDVVVELAYKAKTKGMSCRACICLRDHMLTIETRQSISSEIGSTGC